MAKMSPLAGVQKSATKFWDSAEKDYVVAAASGVVASLLVVPKINSYLDGYLKNVRYTGVVDILIGVGLFALSMHVSAGWAAVGVGIGFAFLLEGAIRVIMPSVAQAAALSGAPAISGILQKVSNIQL